MKLRFSRIKL